MPVVTIQSRLLMTLTGEYLGQRFMNTFLFRCSAVSGAPNDVVAIDALHTKLSTVNDLFSKYIACLPGDGNIPVVQAWYQIIAPIRFRKVERTIELSAFGDYATNTANVQASIERFSDFAGRKGVGGIRVPIGTQACSDGLLGAAILIDLEALAEKMNDIQSTTTPAVSWVPQVGLPGYTPGDPPTPGNPMDSLDCAGASVKPQARIIRRRTVGLGI